MILSVKGQRYPKLEHVFVDAGSTDDSLAIVERHHEHFVSVTSERDDGMYDGINRGFRQTTGEVMTWLNVDDEWFPGTLHVVGSIFAALPEVEWISTALPAAIDEDSAIIKVNRFEGFSRRGFLRGENFAGAGWSADGFIQQESTFWRRSLWERAGATLDASLKSAGDFELWTRFFREAELWCVDVPLGCYRRHASQKTSQAFGQYLDEAFKVFAAAGGTKPNAHFAKLCVGVRRACPAALKRWLARIGVRDARPWVTYDWGRQVWTSDRR